MVYLLAALRPHAADLQKLVLLDYALVYSGDLDGPTSLHTPVPFRGGELMSRRELIQQGLYIMSTRGLVDVTADETGISYIAGPAALTLVGSITAEYFRALEQRCIWVSNRYAGQNSDALVREFSEKGHLWGAEIESYGAKEQLWQ